MAISELTSNEAKFVSGASLDSHDSDWVADTFYDIESSNEIGDIGSGSEPTPTGPCNLLAYNVDSYNLGSCCGD